MVIRLELRDTLRGSSQANYINSLNLVNTGGGKSVWQLPCVVWARDTRGCSPSHISILGQLPQEWPFRVIVSYNQHGEMNVAMTARWSLPRLSMRRIGSRPLCTENSP